MGRAPRFDFEWDSGKARANLDKHGVSFEEAADHEERWITLGEARSRRLVVANHTFEELGRGRFRVRIISARRATKRERRDYEEGL